MSEFTDPIGRFAALLDQARKLDRKVLPEPTAFALGTVDGIRTGAVQPERARLVALEGDLVGRAATGNLPDQHAAGARLRAAVGEAVAVAALVPLAAGARQQVSS